MNCEFKRFETMSPTIPVNFLINWAGGEDKFHMEKETPFLCVLAHLKVTGLTPLLFLILGNLKINF